MSLRPASSTGTARVAVVGAPSDEGTRLRHALAEFGVPGARVDLYAQIPAGGEFLLSEYAGEARMIQAADIDEIVGHDVIFLCEPGSLAKDVTAVASRALVIGMSNCLPPETTPRRVHMDINPDIASKGADGPYAVPHALALMLTDLLHPLDRELGLVNAMAVVIRPASDFGKQGVEELRDQTVRLLSFSEVPVETFGRQLAFNIGPQSQFAANQPDLESRLGCEVADLLGWKENRFTVRLLVASVFFGHGLQFHFRLRTDVALDRVRTVLAEAGFAGPANGEPTTPLDVTGEAQTRFSDLAEDGLGGFWLWAVAGETSGRGASQAVRLAARLAGL